MVCRVKLSSVYRSIRFDVELGGSCMFIRRNPSLRVFAPEERRLKISSTHHLLAPEERHVYRSRQPATFLAPEERHVYRSRQPTTSSLQRSDMFIDLGNPQPSSLQRSDMFIDLGNPQPSSLRRSDMSGFVDAPAI